MLSASHRKLRKGTGYNLDLLLAGKISKKENKKNLNYII